MAQDSTRTQPFVRHISFTRHDVFPQTEGKPFFYKWANALHPVTRKSVVRNELLFGSGDRYDRELTEETERRLRRLAYLGDARILTFPVSEDSVDLEVVTQDQWSTLVALIANSGGGRTELGASIEEYNFGSMLIRVGTRNRAYRR